MAILIDKSTKVLIQGITGREGSRACREMQGYHPNVVAGVTPGKAGQDVDGVPVYNTMSAAVAKHPEANTSLITVPAPFVLDAALEAMSAGIKLIFALAEHVPVRHSAEMYARAKECGARVVGPSSIGAISPGLGKVGSIGSSDTIRVFNPGPVGIISKSGGMTAELSNVLNREGIGQSTVVGIGGDTIAGTDFADLLRLFEADKQTSAVVMFGEIGGTYEEQAAECVEAGDFTKPLVALIAGNFAVALPTQTVLGHAGAIVSKGRGGYDSKITALKRAGVHLAATPEDLPKILKELKVV